MPNCQDLIARALSNPAGLRFSELCDLAECHGWQFDRSRGSHRIYKRAGQMLAMNFQDVRGFAKAYQVRQLLRAIDALSFDPSDP